MTPLVKPYIAPREEMMPAIEKILYSGYIADGEAVRQFETGFAEYVENPNVISVNSGTVALHISLMLIGVGEGDEVVSTALTAEPTNTTIALTGAKIVWADIDEETGLLSAQSIENCITERTKAIMLVHYAGMICDMNAINELSRKYNIPVIEDAAHALGGRYKGKPVGSNSKYTCFSFQAIKHMTTVDGGMLTFSAASAEEIEAAKRLKWFGLSKSVSRLENDIVRAGYKYNMNNVNATIGSVQLRHVNDIVASHISNGKYYDEALKGIPGVKLLKYCADTEPSYWLYTLKVEQRDAFIRMMQENGVTASTLHHRTDTHSAFSESKRELPSLDRFYSEFVHIPCGWWVDEETRSSIVEVIKKGW